MKTYNSKEEEYRLKRVKDITEVISYLTKEMYEEVVRRDAESKPIVCAWIGEDCIEPSKPIQQYKREDLVGKTLKLYVPRFTCASRCSTEKHNLGTIVISEAGKAVHIKTSASNNLLFNSSHVISNVIKRYKNK